jgi:hypothetical protein
VEGDGVRVLIVGVHGREEEELSCGLGWVGKVILFLGGREEECLIID